ncbi:hypothetical protein SmJEL517_g00148 [Synchytrium microbalum]|uniref:Uncharacterized protein n=1 Tax=Synchytrium microbalum TaxID=1806994 RepID=A0A507CG27_9FUNG|nr:uncharacterized protein SmJEL517_g00148 [Synchytrium microbalum]TPX38139.1 hypothetical protein SmJEL517_g00148 [Synchytrium microbalum]
MDIVKRHISLLATAIAISSIPFFGLIWLTRPKNKSVPGPQFSLQFLKQVMAHRKNNSMHEYLASASKAYGPIVRLPAPIFGLMEVILLSDAPESKRILSSQTEFDRTTLMKRLSLSPHALPALVGDEHKRHRKILQPAFAPKTFRQVPAVVDKAMQELFGIWERKRLNGDRIVDASVHMKSLVVEALGEILFGYRFGGVAALEAGTIDKKFENAVFQFGLLTTRRALVPKFLWGVVGLAPSQVQKQVAPLLDMLESMIQKKKKDQLEATSDSDKPKDFLDFLLSMNTDGDGKFTHDEIIDECVTFYLGAQGTTPGTLGFLIYELSLNPELTQRLQEELDEELGADGNGVVTTELRSRQTLTQSNAFLFSLCMFLFRPLTPPSDFSRLLHNIVQESLRLHPSFNPATRIALEDTMILGHKIAKGTNIRVFPMAVHQNSASWNDPTRFDPDRWNQGAHIAGSFLPFGDGIYHCIGKGIAQSLLKTIAAGLFYKYTPRLMDPNIQVKTNLNSTSIHNLMVEFVPRR